MKFIPTSDILTEGDYRHPFSFNYEHYFKVCEERKKRGLKTLEEYKKTFDCRTGYYITGEEIKPEHHPYHDMWLVDNDTNEKFHIDMVSILFHFGKYIAVSKRAEGSQSHGMVNLENISCHCPDVIESINKSKKQYKLVPKK